MKCLPFPRRQSDKAGPRNQSAKAERLRSRDRGRFCVGAEVSGPPSLSGVVWLVQDILHGNGSYTIHPELSSMGLPGLSCFDARWPQVSEPRTRDPERESNELATSESAEAVQAGRPAREAAGVVVSDALGGAFQQVCVVHRSNDVAGSAAGVTSLLLASQLTACSGGSPI